MENNSKQEYTKMKKKVISALLATAMVATMVAGCSSSSSESTTTEAATEAAADTEAADTEAADADADAADTEAESVADAVSDADVDLSDANVAVFYYAYSDTYISSVRTALDAELDGLGVTYQDFDANSNQTTQNEQIDTALQTGANVLVVNIVTSGSVDASQQIVDKASAAGVPVIFFNRAVEGDEEEGTVLGSYDKCAFVGTDAPEAGHMQGEMIGNYLVDNYDAVDLNGDGVISYAMFMGQLGNVEAIYRTQYGVEDANAVLTAAGLPELEYFDSANSDCYQVDQDGNWSATAANNYMTTNLSQFNEDNGNMIELVICNNDSMAEGVISALNDKGYNLGDGSSTTIPVFGVDATDAAKQLIADGKMIGTIKQDAEGMAVCLADLISNAGSGQDIMANTDGYNISENVSNKIYIPYAMYTGE
jgi:methyl-galactoside transport system substrate-binding protein